MTTLPIRFCTQQAHMFDLKVDGQFAMLFELGTDQFVPSYVNMGSHGLYSQIWINEANVMKMELGGMVYLGQFGQQYGISYMLFMPPDILTPHRTLMKEMIVKGKYILSQKRMIERNHLIKDELITAVQLKYLSM